MNEKFASPLVDTASLNSDETPRHEGFTALLRCLLSTDGSTTVFLEALAEEPVVVDVQSQRTCSPGAIPRYILGVQPGEPPLERKSRLYAKHSGTLLCDATAYLFLSSMPRDFARGVAGKEIGLGRLLSECNVESKRVVLAPPKLLPSCGIAIKSYQIVRGDNLICHITESFRLPSLMKFTSA